MEKVHTSLDYAQQMIRQKRRAQRRLELGGNTSEVLEETVKGLGGEGSEKDSGVGSTGVGRRGESFDDVDRYAEEEVLDKEEDFKKLANIYSNVSRWLKTRREYKRQNANMPQYSTTSTV